MCIRITLPPTAEHIAEAQWDLIDALDQALRGDERHSDARRSLRGALREARVQANSPRQWAVAFAQALIETVSTLQAAANAAPAAAKIAQLGLERDYLHSIIGLQNTDQAQIKVLTKERDDLLQRSTQLETALRLSQGEHRREASALQATIGDLNRIVADQQERLDVLGR